MAARLDGVVHEQALNHFVTNSPWPVEPVRARLAELVDQARRVRRATGSAVRSPCARSALAGSD